MFVCILACLSYASAGALPGHNSGGYSYSAPAQTFAAQASLPIGGSSGYSYPQPAPSFQTLGPSPADIAPSHLAHSHESGSGSSSRFSTFSSQGFNGGSSGYSYPQPAPSHSAQLSGIIALQNDHVRTKKNKCKKMFRKCTLSHNQVRTPQIRKETKFNNRFTLRDTRVRVFYT